MHYRREIDGLRAIAVVPVILFHAGFQTFSGGFAGVDVFFVISGYLITSIILNERRAGTFSLGGFYERRARRILPALYVVILCCVPAAWLLMLPDDFENFGQSVLATTLFSTNILLWKTSGYFGLANEFKPLLHTWSLAVEEQFYIFFPLLLLASWRLGRRWPAIVATLLLIVSLAAAQWSAAHAPVANFFLLPTRAWELLIGALIALRGNHATMENLAPRIRELASGLGLLMILYSMVAFDQSIPFPSVFTLVPTVGAALIILFATPATWVGRLLGSKALVGIGLISYSAYLWHQPLLAFERIGSLQEPSVYRTALSVAVTFVLAALTWRCIERPFRNRQLIPTNRVVALSVGLGLCFSLVGWQIYASSGFIDRWPELNAGEFKAAGRRLNAVYNERPYRYQTAGFSDDTKANVLVIGNSFARDFINAALENHYLSSSEIAYSSWSRSCIESEQAIEPRLRALIPQADYIIFGSPPKPPRLACWADDLRVFERLGAKHIVVIGLKNFGWNLNSVMHLPATEKYSYRAKVLEDIWQENEAAARIIPSSYFVNLLALLADANGRVPVFTEDGKLISQDTHHLTQAGAKFVGKILFEHPLLANLK